MVECPGLTGKPAGLSEASHRHLRRAGNPIDYLELYQRLQAKGKGVHFWGSPEELKVAHRELRAERVVYSTSVGSIEEADDLLAWFTVNT